MRGASDALKTEDRCRDGRGTRMGFTVRRDCRDHPERRAGIRCLVYRSGRRLAHTSGSRPCAVLGRGGTRTSRWHRGLCRPGARTPRGDASWRSPLTRLMGGSRCCPWSIFLRTRAIGSLKASRSGVSPSREIRHRKQHISTWVCARETCTSTRLYCLSLLRLRPSPNRSHRRRVHRGSPHRRQRRRARSRPPHVQPHTPCPRLPPRSPRGLRVRLPRALQRCRQVSRSPPQATLECSQCRCGPPHRRSAGRRTRRPRPHSACYRSSRRPAWPLLAGFAPQELSGSPVSQPPVRRAQLFSAGELLRVASHRIRPCQTGWGDCCSSCGPVIHYAGSHPAPGRCLHSPGAV